MRKKKNLRGWPLFKILPRGSVYPSFKIGFIQSKVTISWSLVGGIRFFSFFLIKNDGMGLNGSEKIEFTQKYLSLFPHSIISWGIIPIPPSPSAEGDGGIGMMPQEMMEWGNNERYFCVNSIFSLPFKPIPSFLMRKNEKKRIPPTRDQEIVTLDWMNPILNDG